MLVSKQLSILILKKSLCLCTRLTKTINDNKSKLSKSEYFSVGTNMTIRFLPSPWVPKLQWTSHFFPSTPNSTDTPPLLTDFPKNKGGICRLWTFVTRKFSHQVKNFQILKNKGVSVRGGVSVAISVDRYLSSPGAR